MYRGFIFLLLTAGISCVLFEYSKDASEYFLHLVNRRQPVFEPTRIPPDHNELPGNAKVTRNGRKVTVKRPVTITPYGGTGLRFTIQSPTAGAPSYISREGTLFAYWFIFEFKSDETLLTVHFGSSGLNLGDRDMELIASVYFSREKARLENRVGVRAGFLSYLQPASVEEIVAIINQGDGKEKTALLNVGWIEELFLPEKPRRLSSGGVEYLCNPFILEKEVLEKLQELKDRMVNN